MFLRLALVTRLVRGNGKLGCAMTGGIRFWGCYWKGMLGTGWLTMGGFRVVLSRKLANTSVKGWRLDISIGSALDDDTMGKKGLASSKGNSTSSSSTSLFKLTDPCGRNLPCSSHHLPLRCMQLNFSHWWKKLQLEISKKTLSRNYDSKILLA